MNAGDSYYMNKKWKKIREILLHLLSRKEYQSIKYFINLEQRNAIRIEMLNLIMDYNLCLGYYIMDSFYTDIGDSLFAYNNKLDKMSVLLEISKLNNYKIEEYFLSLIIVGRYELANKVFQQYIKTFKNLKLQKYLYCIELWEVNLLEYMLFFKANLSDYRIIIPLYNNQFLIPYEIRKKTCDYLCKLHKNIYIYPHKIYSLLYYIDTIDVNYERKKFLSDFIMKANFNNNTDYDFFVTFLKDHYFGFSFRTKHYIKNNDISNI